MKDALISAAITLSLFIAVGALLTVIGVVKPTKRGLEIKVPIERVDTATSNRVYNFWTNKLTEALATERKSEDVFTIYYGNVPIAQCRRCTNCGEPVVRCLDAIETPCPNHGK